MRPIRLKMTGFGPYVDNPVLDFRKLGQNGLYLITGDTGAGKTTIFDAITFALFGEASGGNRKPGMLRSKYAGPETGTEVILVFEYAGKTYEIRRNPEYERPKQRGQGFTRESAKAELILPDGRVLTNLKEVNQAVVDILGVNRDQFSQIAMIAQGDFLKLLLASTEDRKRIFQKLFRTQNYNLLQDALKAESLRLGREYEQASRSIRQYVDGILCGEADLLLPRVVQAKSGALPTEEIIELLEILIRQDEAAEQRITAEITAAEQACTEVTNRLAVARARKATEESLDRSVRRLAELEALLASALQAKEAAASRQPEIEALRSRAAEIQAMQQSYEDMEQLRQRREALSGSILRRETEISGRKADLDRAKQALADLKEELDTLRSAPEQEPALKAEQDALIRQREQIRELDAALGRLRRKYRLLQDQQQDYQRKSGESLRLNRIWQDLQKAFLDEQAGILADGLIDGVPCPVCGSLSHPRPAVKSAAAPSEEDLKRAKQRSEAADRDAAAASQLASAAKGEYEAGKAALLTDAARLGEVKELQDVAPLLAAQTEQLTDRLAAVERELGLVRRMSVRKREIEDRLLPQNEARIAEGTELLSGEEQKQTVDRTELNAVLRRIDALSRTLPYPSLAEAKKQIAALQQQAKALDDEIRRTAEEHAFYDKEITGCRGKIEEARAALEGSLDFDPAREQLRLRELDASKTGLDRQRQDILHRQKTNVWIRSELRKTIGNAVTIEKRWTWIKALSDTANGALSGKEKIMLEAYVQAAYFDRILARANTRLMVMSDGQYELKRRVDGIGKTSQSGLDLDVVDHYNGSERSVKTLSGGESFLASLSLALGLSEEIQSSAGGIRLDTMFVDEGFGSLDEDTLKQAMQALVGLTEGNRLVGIISHVSELKNRIDNHIIVKKTRSGGSRAEIL